jgi:ATP-binding cassette subfamily B protein
MKRQDNKKAPKGTLRKILALLRPYRIWIALSVLFSAVSVAGSLYVPICVGRIIDCILGPGQVDFRRIADWMLRIAAVVGVTALCQWAYGAMNNRVTYQVVHDVRAQAFAKLQILPFRYLDNHPVGEIVSRLIADVDQFADGLLLGFTQLFTGVVTILGTLAFMISIQPLIALAVVVLTPLSFVAARFIASHTHRFFLEQSEARADQTAFLDEMLGSQKLVKAFGREARSVEDFDRLNETLQTVSRKAVFFSSLTNPVTRFVNSVVYAVVVLTGALLCVSTAGTASVFTVGALSALLSYANQYTKPFNEISGVITEFQNALACAGRIFALLEEASEQPDRPDAKVLTDCKGCVSLRDVRFSYDPAQSLIEDLDLTVQSGQRIAIVGPTGCGKTTLINLLMRFYDADGGSISVDGTDVRDLTRESLRASYGMVLQETWLRSGTIRENLILGKPDASDDEIIAACKQAHAWSFIRRLPQGLDTVIGEDGGSLSQGQKQLLCIARVMLCLPPMLILDEATSSIDTRTEINIQKAFSTMMQGRTSFIVAHRLNTIRDADRILVMNRGRVIEIGTHETLLAQDGFYAKLYNSQFAQ